MIISSVTDSLLLFKCFIYLSFGINIAIFYKNLRRYFQYNFHREKSYISNSVILAHSRGPNRHDLACQNAQILMFSLKMMKVRPKRPYWGESTALRPLQSPTTPPPFPNPWA